MNLKGRNFLTLKDFTPEEILYMVDLAAELKDKKKKGILTTDMHAGKTLHSYLKRQVQEPDALLKWQHMTSEWEQRILIHQVRRLVKRKHCRYSKSPWKNV